MEDCHLACSSSATISSLAAACNTAGLSTQAGIFGSATGNSAETEAELGPEACNSISDWAQQAEMQS